MRLADYAQFRIPPGFRDAVATLAREEGVSTSEFMRRAILADVEERRADGVTDHPENRGKTGACG